MARAPAAVSVAVRAPYPTREFPVSTPASTPASPSQLSRELREGQSPDLTRRRWVAGLSLLGAAMGQLVALYQIGIVKRLPDPDPSGALGRVFDATKVDASDYAYERLQTPDGFLMIGTYAVTAGLAAAGGERRAEDRPYLPLAMAAKVGYDVFTNLSLAREEWGDNHRLCQYCQLASAASIASLALALPEAARAARGLVGRR